MKMYIEVTDETINDGIQAAVDESFPDLDLALYMDFIEDCFQTVVDYYDMFGTIRADYRQIVLDTAKNYGLEE